MEKCKLTRFKKKVRDFYTQYGRYALPWRKTRNPYHILVSEIMLQQTQVERVCVKYKEFLKVFPTVASLANAPLKEVLQAWSGLGYNRRARFLHSAAQEVVKTRGGKFPREYAALLSLPGVGPYTAGAVSVFAYNTPQVMIETNIRSVYLHEFFEGHGAVHDVEIMPYIEATLDRENPREWYAALMDYGSHLKKALPNPSRKSRHHAVQSAFKGSKRELRGCIIRELGNQNYSSEKLATLCVRTQQETNEVLKTLHLEGMVQKKKKYWSL